MKLFGTLFLFLLVVLAVTIRAEEDFDEEVGDIEDGDVEIEDDTEELDLGMDEGVVAEDELAGDDEDEEDDSNVEVDIQKYFPEAKITAGKVSEVLVSVKINKAALNEYTFGTIEGGFHYPQDWSYKVQNFSAIRYNRKLEPGQEATFMYPFMAAELSGGRSYGLQLNLHYQSDASPPQFFSDAIYNETVEVAENMDNAAAEQFFMFLTFSAFAGIGFAYFASKFGTKKKPAPVIETGTTATADSSWIPKEHMKPKQNTSPKTSPKASARRRKAD